MYSIKLCTSYISSFPVKDCVATMTLLYTQSKDSQVQEFVK